MAIYRVTYRRAYDKDFYIEAENADEAESKFYEMDNRGEIDLSDLEVTDCYICNIEED